MSQERPDQGKGPMWASGWLQACLLAKGREINLNLPSAVSPSISGVWQLFTLSGSGVSCWGEVISQRRGPGGVAAGREPNRPAWGLAHLFRVCLAEQEEVVLKWRRSGLHSAWAWMSRHPPCFSRRWIWVGGRRQKVETQISINCACSLSCLPRPGDELHRVIPAPPRTWSHSMWFGGTAGQREMICDSITGVWLILELSFPIICWLIWPLNCKQQKPILFNIRKESARMSGNSQNWREGLGSRLRRECGRPGSLESRDQLMSSARWGCWIEWALAMLLVSPNKNQCAGTERFGWGVVHFKKVTSKDCPGNLVDKTPHDLCRGCMFNPCSGY